MSIRVLPESLEVKQKRLNDAREAVRQAEHQKWMQEEYPELAKRVGKCFKTRNSYSCPSKPSDYWWLYRKVLSIEVESQSIRCLEFQIDKDGRADIRVSTMPWYYCRERGIPINAQEWKRAAKKVQRIAAQLTLKSFQDSSV